MIDVIDRILVSEEEIVRRSKELGKQISEDYRKKGTTPIVIGLLKGSVPFLAEIMKHIDLDIEIDFMDVSSYDGAESVGDVKINKDLRQIRKGRIHPAGRGYRRYGTYLERGPDSCSSTRELPM